MKDRFGVLVALFVALLFEGERAYDASDQLMVNVSGAEGHSLQSLTGIWWPHQVTVANKAINTKKKPKSQISRIVEKNLIASMRGSHL